MPRNLLKISLPISFVMRRSPVRVREVALKRAENTQSIVNEYVRVNLTCSFLHIYAYFEWMKAVCQSAKYTRIGTDSVTKSVTFSVTFSKPGANLHKNFEISKKNQNKKDYGKYHFAVG